MAGPKLITFTKILAGKVQEVEDAFESLSRLMLIEFLSGAQLDAYVRRIGVFRMDGDDDARIKLRAKTQVLINTTRVANHDRILRILHMLLPDNTFTVYPPTRESELSIYVNEPVLHATWGMQASKALADMHAAGANAQLHYYVDGFYFGWEEDTNPQAAGFDYGRLWSPAPSLEFPDVDDPPP